MTSRANPKSLLSSITMVTASVVLKVRFCEATRKPPLHSEPSVYHTNASRASVPRPKNPSTGKSAPGSPRKHLSPPNGPRRSGPSPDQISRPALPESLPKLPVPRGRSFKKPALSRSAACPNGLVHAKEPVLPGAGLSLQGIYLFRLRRALDLRRGSGFSPQRPVHQRSGSLPRPGRSGQAPAKGASIQCAAQGGQPTAGLQNLPPPMGQSGSAFPGRGGGQGSGQLILGL